MRRRWHEDGHCQQKRGLAPLVSTPVSARSQQDQLHLCARLPQVARGFPSWSVQAVPPAATEADVRNTRLQHIHESNLAGAGNGMGDCTRSPLNRRVSRTDTANGVERSGSNDSGSIANVTQTFTGTTKTKAPIPALSRTSRNLCLAPAPTFQRLRTKYRRRPQKRQIPKMLLHPPLHRTNQQKTPLPKR